MKWFGKPWNNNLCKPDSRIEAPEGQKCPKCTSHIEKSDQGVILQCIVDVDLIREVCIAREEAWHLDCFLKTTLPPDLFKRQLRIAGIRNSGYN